MDDLTAAYEKTSLHRMGIPLETALARVSWLREVLQGSAPRRHTRPNARPAQAAGKR